MKKISALFIFIFLLSCTSNTIFEKPKDLIPRDTMSLLLQEMVIASSAKFVKNKNQQKNINYMPFVYEKFKIDSTRFDISNYYYMSKIDMYQEILENAKASIESRNNVFKKTKKREEARRKDSLDCIKSNQQSLDSVKNLAKIEDSGISKKVLDTLFKRK
jgi:cysteinyl-tRNA synthetase